MRALKRHARWLKAEMTALYIAYRDPRAPWYAKLVVAVVLAYAFSPIDLIPDPVPILGYLDDLVLVPLGIALALKLIPPVVLSDARNKAREMAQLERPTSWVAGALIVILWLLFALGAGWLALNFIREMRS